MNFKKITSKYRQVRIKKKELDSHIEINGDHLYPGMGKRKHITYMYQMIPQGNLIAIQDYKENFL